MGKVLAILRLLVIVLSMAIMLGLYLLSQVVVPHTDRSSFKLRRRWIRWFGKPGLGLRTTVEGSMIDGPAIYVCNHRSFSDPVVNSSAIDAYIIAKAEIASYPLISKGAETTGIIWVDRHNRDSRLATRQAMIDAIAAGRNILVYPEGTVSNKQTILEYKRGPFKTAAQNNITIVPVAIEYRDTRDLWVTGGLMQQYFRQFGKLRTYAKMRIGPPLTSADDAHLYEAAVTWTQEALLDMQAGWSKAVYE